MRKLISLSVLSIGLLTSALRAEWVTLTVASDGSGTHKTVQEAIDSIPDGKLDPVLINIKPGTYKDRINIERGKPAITLKGLGSKPDEVVLTYDLNAKSVIAPSTQPVGTSGSASTTINSKDFMAENVTFENSAGDNGQALAIKIQGDRGIYKNCRFLGWQDTLDADGGRQYFKDCYIEGRVDFIFGGSTAVFDHCTIKSKNGGFVTAARTKPETEYGYVFLDCSLISGDEKPVPTYLGRPWQWDRQRVASVTFIRTKMGPHIKAEGWNPWSDKNTEPEKTTRFAEYGSMDLDGKPLDISKRVKWAKSLTSADADKFVVNVVLSGDDGWDPTK